MEYKEGDKVTVSPTATGIGEWKEGIVDNIECLSGGYRLVSVTYSTPDCNGMKGIVLSNLNLLKKASVQICYKTNEPCAYNCQGICKDTF